MIKSGLVSRTSTDDWEEALISGNGRHGALSYGGPKDILVTLSHERLFLPVDGPLAPPATAGILPRLRDHLGAGTLRFCPTGESGPLGGGSGEAAGYQRTADFETGVVTQHWTTSAGILRHELFVSRADDVVVARFVGPVSGRMSLSPIAGRPPVPIETSVIADARGLRLTARFPDRWPGGIAGYEVECRVVVRGGTSAVDGADLVVAGANEVLMLIRLDVDAAPPAAGRGPLERLPADFDTLLAPHAAIHGELLRRVHLDLGGDERFDDTEEMLAREVGSARVERLFDAGRYAVISSTGDLPPNLQGVWTGTYTPAWFGDCTLDGNVEPALAAMLSTGLREAAERSVEHRWAWWRENGDEMAFGLVRLGLAAATLGMAETAHEIVVHLAGRYWRPSLVPTHNAGQIFNIDICGGFAALIVAMLLRSAHGRVDLLPALPEAWPRGEARGLPGRDRVTATHLAWRPGRLEADLRCAEDRQLTVSWPSGARPPTVQGADVIHLLPDSATLAMGADRPATLTISWP